MEKGLLIDVFEQFGLGAIAQVDLLERIHRNQGLEALSKMSFAIIQTVLRKIEIRSERSILEDVNKTMKLIRHISNGYFLAVEEIAEQERPPMISLPIGTVTNEDSLISKKTSSSAWGQAPRSYF